MEDPYAPAAAAGIHRIAVPTPFAVGRVNVYLIEDDPLTLVDSGPNSGTSLHALEQGLAALGYEVEQLERILVTHEHIDHEGLVQILADRSGAEVAGLDRLVPLLGNYSDTAAADDDFAMAMMARHGLSDELVAALNSVFLGYRGWGASVTITRPLRPGDTLTFANRSLEVLFRPGHSATDTLFLDRARGLLIAGDHLLRTISSNPLISRSPDGGRRRALAEYIESLRLTREMDVSLVLPGHGDPIENHGKLIDARLGLSARRAEKIFGLIVERPQSGFELAQAMWGDLAVTEAFLTLSEVLGHTDLLLADGRVIEEEATAGRAIFRSAGSDIGAGP